LAVKENPEIPLSMNEMRIAQAGGIAFSISTRGVEPTRHAFGAIHQVPVAPRRDALPRLAEKFLAALEMLAMNWVRSKRAGAARATSLANRRCGFLRLNRWWELSAAAAIYATPLEVAASFALFSCSRDNRKYAVQYAEGILWKAFCQHRFKLCIKRRDALRRQARTHSRTGANAPAPCFV
jgi:hypothetical protein